MTWRSKKVYIGGPLLLILLLAVLIPLLRSEEKGTSVQADLAYRDDISEVVTASGRVQPQTKVDITSEVSAEIVALYVKEGDRVERGQSLLLLDTVQLKSDVAQARYSLQELSARVDAAESEFKKDELEANRQARLFEQKLTSETAATDARLSMEGARANYQAMRAQANTAQARLEKAEDNLAKTLIQAPMAGVVTMLNTEVGEIAQAQTSFTQGKTLMTISDLSVFEVDVDVDETEVAKVSLGQEATLRVDAFADTTFKGQVTEIGNSALVQGEGTQNLSTNFRVTIRFTDAETNLRPGMSATAEITTATAKEALLIPYAALVTREFDPDSLQGADSGRSASGSLANEAHAAEADPSPTAAGDRASNPAPAGKSKKIKRSGVFVYRDGHARFVEVKAGIADARNVVALSGVAPGDTVISGSFQTLRKLKPDEEVRIEEASLAKLKEHEG
jgi:HlyD family secretion protein